MRFYFYIAILLLGISFSCGHPQPVKHTLQGPAFGTTYGIQFYGGDPEKIASGIDSVLTVVNRSMSTYIPDSDISRINRGDTTLVVDQMFREVYELSEIVWGLSEGYFDPTIGVLRNAYGFGDDRPLARIDSTTIDSLLQFVGFDKVRLLPRGTMEKELPEIYFDFNAVAKGYGIDRIGAMMEVYGVEHYLIELGGELLSKGQNLDKAQSWTVGIESVESELGDRAYQAAVRLENTGMASSGNYRKFRIDSLTGVRYVHTINPITGGATASNLTSATVIASNCATADAFATAFMAVGLEKSIALIEQHEELEGYLTYTDGPVDRVYISPGFKALLID